MTKDAYAGQYLRKYETDRYSFVERHLRFLDTLQSIIVHPDAEQFADVSYWQEGMDWDEYAKHARAVILRIGIGRFKDTEFETNYREAKARGIAVGVYVFWDDRYSPAEHARMVIDALAGKTLELEIFFDWEVIWGGPFGTVVHVVAAMQVVEQAGIISAGVGLYSGYYFFVEHTNPVTHAPQFLYLKQRPLWIAWYAAAALVREPRPWTTWTHWQMGTPAIEWGQPTREIDMNKSRLARDAFADKYLGGVSSPPPTQPPTGGSMKGTVRSNVTLGLNVRNAAGSVVSKLWYRDVVYGEVQSDRLYYSKIYRANGSIELLNGVCSSATREGTTLYMDLTNEAEPTPPPDPEPGLPDLPVVIILGDDVTYEKQVINVVLKPK